MVEFTHAPRRLEPHPRQSERSSEIENFQNFIIAFLLLKTEVEEVIKQHSSGATLDNENHEGRSLPYFIRIVPHGRSIYHVNS